MRTPDAILIIPAAGAGTRLQSSTPKVLSPVNGRAMIDYLFERYKDAVRRVVLVVHPSFEADVKRHVDTMGSALDVQYAQQPAPTGMLDAVLLARDAAQQQPSSRIWVTWCDQIGVHPDTIAMLRLLSEERAETPVILPTAQQTPPYIHLDRDGDGRITAIRQRREGDDMPAVGESDMGLFSLSPEAYFTLLPQFSSEATQASATRERNFLPFLPWLVQRGHSVVTFPSTNDMESVGINTPDDRRRLEDYLRDMERP
ncbi:MAG TPA: NTP transferase domain-containing protein [Vicinamibacterales bacterium]|nr:NTP transferase domain-containing protein [Vicinamibacterales bacterium]